MNPRPDNQPLAVPGPPPGAAEPVVRVLADNRARFLAFLERRLGGREPAEELLQEALLRAISRAGSLRDGESAIAWFYRLLRNTLTDHFRQLGSQRRAHDAVAAEPTPPAPGPDEELFHAVCACVGETLATLKPEYAQALRLVDLEDGDVSRLAAAANISSGNAAVRLHRARQSLRKRLEEVCGGCAEHACLDCGCPRPRGTADRDGDQD